MMKSFKSFVVEAAFSSEEDKSHYTHIEDEIYVSGKKSIAKISGYFHDLIKGIPETVNQTKIDGAPSVFYGYQNGKFFVATKSIFNKDPKVNFTVEDIERNHGHAPGLVAKLKLALEYFPYITNNKNEILQGDMMFAKADLKKVDIEGIQHWLFKPNTVINAVPVNSVLGKEIAKSVVGFAPHTKYNASGSRVTIQARDMKKNSHVFLMPIDAPSLDHVGHLKAHITEVDKLLASIPGDAFAYISSEEMNPHFLAYANYVIRNNTDQSYAGFLAYMKEKLQKFIDKVKSEKAKADKQVQYDTITSQIETNKGLITNVLDVHNKLADIKDKIIDELDTYQPIRRYFENEFGALVKTNPEGYVLLGKHGTAKLVKRRVFSMQNFAQGSFRKAAPKDE
jgi:hypothetical protein